MLPIALNLSSWPVLLAGSGRAVAQRLALLDEAGAAQLSVFSPDPDPAFRLAAGTRLQERLPDIAEITAARVVFLAGLPQADTIRLAEAARAHRVLLNAEDDPPWCDFYMSSIVRRGRLVLSVSTGGASPAIAVRIRRWLSDRFGPEWSGHLEEAASLRQSLRAAGAPTGPGHVGSYRTMRPAGLAARQALGTDIPRPARRLEAADRFREHQLR